jgi:hypothetical protein
MAPILAADGHPRRDACAGRARRLRLVRVTLTTRRDNVPFDPRHFERLASQGVHYSPREAFEYIYRTHHWRGSESKSGEGAGEDQTAHLKAILPDLLRELQTRTLLDVPCGDYTWLRQVELPVTQYIGADVVPSLIAEHQAHYGDDRHRFAVLDLRVDALPVADVLLCRDCLVHLSFADIALALGNIRRSGISYLLTTTFPACERNEDTVTGDWRLLNLELAPFNFPPPVTLFNEQCTEGGGLFRDKSLGLWRVEALTDAV